MAVSGAGGKFPAIGSCKQADQGCEMIIADGLPDQGVGGNFLGCVGSQGRAEAGRQGFPRLDGQAQELCVRRIQWVTG